MHYAFELPFMRRRREALEHLRGDNTTSNLHLIGGLQKAESVFAAKPNVRADDCFLLPLTAGDQDIIDFYGVPEDPHKAAPKLQRVLVNADDDLKAEALIINSEKPDRARLLSLQGHGAGALYNSVA